MPKITGLHAMPPVPRAGELSAGNRWNGAVLALLSRIGQVSVAIIAAPSLIHARMRAALDRTDAGATFAEGYELDADYAARVPPEPPRSDALVRRSCGLRDRIDHGERPPSGTQKRGEAARLG
jgi:hypothetical protein